LGFVFALEFTRNTQRLFAQQELREKRRLLNFLLSNCAWDHGNVVATFRQAFDVFAETALCAWRAVGGEAAKLAKRRFGCRS
jgi:hypothetical protein